MAMSKQQMETLSYLAEVVGLGSFAYMAFAADMPYIAEYFAVLAVVALVPRRSKQHKEIFNYWMPVFVGCGLVYMGVVLDMPYSAVFLAALLTVLALVPRRWWKAGRDALAHPR